MIKATTSGVLRGGLRGVLSTATRFSGILDRVPGAAAACSLELLARSFANAPVVRVRRDSDNAEQNFTAAEVSGGALVAFCGAGNGFVRRLYDQSGNTRHATQTAALSQPLLVENGELVTENGKAAIKFIADPISSLNFSDPIAGIKTIFAVSKRDAASVVNYILGSSVSGSSGIGLGGSLSGVDGLFGFDGDNVRSISGENLLTKLGYWNIREGSIYMAENGNSETNAGAFAREDILVERIGTRRPTTTADSLKGKVSEIILFTSDQSANRTKIEANIMKRYNL